MTAAWGVASYAYDGHGRRAFAQMTNGRTVLRAYSQRGTLLFTRDAWKGDTRHIHLGGKVVAETNTQTGTRWVHTDALGSPMASTGPGGGVIERTRYEPYGATVGGTNPDGIGFTGHVNDPDTGLVYMQQRYYEPLAGRFLSVDPVTTNAKDGSFFGRYHYANNNPYKFVDPDGRAGALAACAAGPVGCAVGVAVTIAVGAKALSDTAKIVQSTSSNSSSSGSGQQGGGDKAPSVPDKLVGTVDDKSGQQGGRVNNGPLAPDNGGTGDAAKDFGKLTGGKIGESGKYPGVRGENGIGMRPGKEGEGPRIDIPANGNKPAETLHYPKPEPK
jgi:RHS repeat-associated protein